MVRDLSAVRDGWDEIERTESRLIIEGSAEETFRHWLRLQQAFEFQLRDSATVFGEERVSALAELQARLHRLSAWQERHGDPGPIHPEAPAAPPGK
jgi:hypothetical protein